MTRFVGVGFESGKIVEEVFDDAGVGGGEVDCFPRIF